MSSSGAAALVGDNVLEKKPSESTVSLPKDLEKDVTETQVVEVEEDRRNEPVSFTYHRHPDLLRRVTLGALVALIFAWWISATILPATHHRWIVQSFFAWSFISIIAFRFIPNSIVTRPIEAFWIPFVQNPFFNLPKIVRYAIGWFALLTIILGSAFGFKLENVCIMPFFSPRDMPIHIFVKKKKKQGTNYGDRAISVLGLFIFQFGFWATSLHRSHIQWRTVIVGLFMQQAIALFILKSGTGFHLFHWLATLASDFLAQGLAGAVFFFDQDTVNKHWFFVNVVRHESMRLDDKEMVFSRAL
jgi:concentrative nucleoside transporter, CNT family